MAPAVAGAAAPLLTTDPVVAATPFGAPDYGWSFPHGGYWAVTPKNVARWYGHRFWDSFTDPGIVNRYGDLSEHPVFVLRLDLEYFAANVDRERWTPAERIRALCAYLRPGREEWGDAGDPPPDRELAHRRERGQEFITAVLALARSETSERERQNRRAL